MGKKLTQKQFIEKAHDIHKNRYEYTLVVYENNATKIKIICPLHGIFFQTPRDHLTGRGCFECSRDHRSTSQRMTVSQFIQKARKIHGSKYDYRDVQLINNNKNKIWIQCPWHGTFLQTVASHLFGCGCPLCGVESRAIKNTLTTHQFVILAIEKHGDKYSYSNTTYINAKEPVEIECKNHNRFYQKPNDHLDGHGCPKCNKTVSSIESRWLDYLGIPNDKQHRTVTIKIGNKKRFVVDGFDESTKTIYEFYGDFWHGNPTLYKPNEHCKVTKKTFGQMYSDTLMKEKTLKDNGYQLISIWEVDARMRLGL